MQRVIITGASGFIGKALTEKLLNRGYEVWAIVRDKHKLRLWNNYDNLKIIVADLSEYKNLDKKIKERSFEGFFHFAWDGVYGEAFADYEKQLKNALYTCDSFLLARKLGCKKYIFPGSIVEQEVRSCIESNELNLRIATIYGMSKLSSEMIIKTLSNKYNDIKLNIVYPPYVYGIGDNSKMLPKFLMQNLIVGNSPKLVEGNFLHDWIYIDDLIEAILAVFLKGKNKQSYYLGNRNLKTFKEVVKRVRNIINPYVNLKFGEYPDNITIDYSKVDLNKLYIDTGFEIKSSFEDTIKKTAKWIKEDMKKDV